MLINDLRVQFTKSPYCIIYIIETLDNWEGYLQTDNDLLDNISDCLDRIYCKYENVCLIGDLNCNMHATPNVLTDTCDSSSLSIIIKDPTLYRGEHNSLIDVFLTNQKGKTLAGGAQHMHVSDSHCMIYCALRAKLPNMRPRKVAYRS